MRNDQHKHNVNATEQKIALQNKNSFVVSDLLFRETENVLITDAACALGSEMVLYGYVPSVKLLRAISTLNNVNIQQFRSLTLQALKETIGAHIQHKPMYPNFPNQVREMDDFELFMNAILHYTTWGQWSPEYDKLPREYQFEVSKLKTVDVIGHSQFLSIFTEILGANDSIPEQQKQTVEWFINNVPESLSQIPSDIPFKENLAYLASILFANGKHNYLEQAVSNGTDVLRVAAALSQADVSLAENPRFRNFNRRERRAMVNALEKTLNIEDAQRRPGVWTRLFHQLHVGDYSKRVYDIAKTIREGEKVKTFNSAVEQMINDGRYVKAAIKLSDRPGELSRRMTDLLRKTAADKKSQQNIVDTFAGVIDHIPTRTLLQLDGALKTHVYDQSALFVMPKGQTQKAIKVEKPLVGLGDVANTVQQLISNQVIERASKQEPLGNVYIDPALAKCPVPSGLRSASDNARIITRGTRLPVAQDDRDTIRLFVYWVGRDIDLSAVFLNENFHVTEEIAYYKLRSEHNSTFHSGDITNAPKGASEFIDIDIPTALNNGHRYVSCDVRVFTGPMFSEHEEAFVGWMTRKYPDSNEIYEPSTVEGKVDLVKDSRFTMPFLFDLQTREVIWTDLHKRMSNRPGWDGSGSQLPNNVATTHATVQELVEVITNLSNTRTTLYDLLTWHAFGRGEIVNDRQDADVVFGIDEDSDVAPWSITRINEEFLA